jgi:hypothetical protein
MDVKRPYISQQAEVRRVRLLGLMKGYFLVKKLYLPKFLQVNIREQPSLLLVLNEVIMQT